MVFRRDRGNRFRKMVAEMIGLLLCVPRWWVQVEVLDLARDVFRKLTEKLFKAPEHTFRCSKYSVSLDSVNGR